MNPAMIDIAKERLIQRRETHLDQLVDKLKEGRGHTDLLIIWPHPGGVQRVAIV